MKPYRKAIFAVVYNINSKGNVKYLILKRKKNWKGWEFTKGGVDKGESLIKAVRREVNEETGQKILKIKSFHRSGGFKYDKNFLRKAYHIGQKWKLFSVQVKKGKVKLDEGEHSGFKWMSFSQALRIITWKDQRTCLKIVNSYLKNEL